MSTSQSSQDIPVYLGIWTNWSQGTIAGLTLTTTQQQGGLLIAFLALFVTFTGSCFWTIISFTTHQVLSRQGAQNALYHQRQAILRNSDTSAVALWRLIRMSWSWRGNAPKSWIRSTLFPLVLSLITFCAFAVAGLFSSRVATSRGGEVLVIGGRCATLNGSLLTNENSALVQTYLCSRIRSSATYASTCYLDHRSTDSCRTFVRSSLPYSISRNVECPFPGKGQICRKLKGAIRLDSGYLKSHTDLGINTPPSSRFLYRTVNECASIRTIGSSRRASNHSTTETMFSLLYGKDMMGGCAERANCTFEFVATRGEDYHMPRYEYDIKYAIDGRIVLIRLR